MKGTVIRSTLMAQYRNVGRQLLVARAQRKRIAAKLRNPRLLQVSFHTFHNWKATMEYHKTGDILHVMQLLGHRNIKNTLARARYVCDHGSHKIFRKRK